jgi:conflict system STAND superfamily ATPase
LHTDGIITGELSKSIGDDSVVLGARTILELYPKFNWIQKILFLWAMSLSSAVSGYVGRQHPIWYAAFGFFVGTLPALGLCWVIRKVAEWIVRRRLSRTGTSTVLSSDNGIKFLSSFRREDAAVYAKLERGAALNTCLQAITSPTFKFGILSGESGVGKSSFLQAGILPNLEHRRHRALYVRFSTVSSSEALRYSLLEHGFEIAERGDLGEILHWLSHRAGDPVVLLLDQFEQLLVPTCAVREREHVASAIENWYRDKSSRLKVVVSVRTDYYGALNQLLHGRMGYALSPAEDIQLTKFTTAQAANIIACLAETATISFDRQYLDQLADELAGNDRLVSPVDIQIVAEAVAQSPEHRSFQRSSIQQLGGLDRILSDFLDGNLRRLPDEGSKGLSIAILLLLANLEAGTRAVSLTIKQICNKTGFDLSAVSGVLDWLVSRRLVSPTESGAEKAYELAHERLIHPLRLLAQKQLSEADRASSLLERRANEWATNNRDPHFLLRRRERMLIAREYTRLRWGKDEKLKRQLLESSLRKAQQRIRIGVAGFSFVCALVVAGLVLYEWTNVGHAMRIKREVRHYVDLVNDDTVLEPIARSLAAANERRLARCAIDRITDPYAKLRSWQEVIKADLHVLAPDTLNDVKTAMQLEGQAEGLNRNDPTESTPYTQSFQVASLLDVILLSVDAGRRFQDAQMQMPFLLKADNLYRSEGLVVAQGLSHEFYRGRNPALVEAALWLAEEWEQEQHSDKADAIYDQLIQLARSASVQPRPGWQLPLRERGKIAYNVYDMLPILLRHASRLKDHVRTRWLLQRVTNMILHEPQNFPPEYQLDQTDFLVAVARQYQEIGDLRASSQRLMEAIDLVPSAKGRTLSKYRDLSPASALLELQDLAREWRLDDVASAAETKMLGLGRQYDDKDELGNWAYFLAIANARHGNAQAATAFLRRLQSWDQTADADQQQKAVLLYAKAVLANEIGDLQLVFDSLAELDLIARNNPELLIGEKPNDSFLENAGNELASQVAAGAVHRRTFDTVQFETFARKLHPDWQIRVLLSAAAETPDPAIANQLTQSALHATDGFEGSKRPSFEASQLVMSLKELGRYCTVRSQPRLCRQLAPRLLQSASQVTSYEEKMSLVEEAMRCAVRSGNLRLAHQAALWFDNDSLKATALTWIVRAGVDDHAWQEKPPNALMTGLPRTSYLLSALE